MTNRRIITETLTLLESRQAGLRLRPPPKLLVHAFQRVGRAQRVPLRRREAEEREELVARFWELTPSEPGDGEDGLAWFMEARRNGSYHVVVRIPEEGPFRQVGELMLSLARPPLPEAAH